LEHIPWKIFLGTDSLEQIPWNRFLGTSSIHFNPFLGTSSIHPFQLKTWKERKIIESIDSPLFLFRGNKVL
jgi:hypothetical protein